MCGIIAYTGRSQAVPILLEGLKRLEYRGYDSAGIAYQNNGGLELVKTPGKLSSLESSLDRSKSRALSETPHAEHIVQCGVGHTRWATHGVPNQANAHPHCDNSHTLSLVHNGIIENHAHLRQWLEGRGHRFHSETDTEVLVHLVAEHEPQSESLTQALSRALSQVQGSFALALISSQPPGSIWAARRSSPLVLGTGSDGFFVASDIPAFLPYTRDVVFLEDDELLLVDQSAWRLYQATTLEPLTRSVQRVEWDIRAAEKDGHPHFMLKEILQQPQVIRDCLSGRVDPETNTAAIPEVEQLSLPSRIRIVACGTSFHAGLWARYVLEEWTDIQVDVEIASEFRYRKLSFSEDEIVIAVSQSGETADTMAGLRIALEKGIPVLGLCNVLGSSIARTSDAVLYTQAGPEISVASTKAMCSQMIALLLLAVHWGRRKGTLSAQREREIIDGLRALPEEVEHALPGTRERARHLAGEYSDCRSFLFLGRGLGYPLALEGALKLKELSYIHAEGYAAGEMKHGPIALIEETFPTFAVDPGDGLSGKLLSNLQEVRARLGPVILLAPPDVDFQQADRWDLPGLPWPLSSFAVLPAIQLFAYETAVLLGKDVDQPRNLAKSVTVE